VISYFNYTKHVADSWWDRRDFAQRWWRLGRADQRWTPPYYPALRQALDPKRNPYLAQRSPLFLHMEALPRRARSDNQTGGTGFAGALMEEPVAATVVLADENRHDGTAYLSLFHCVNDGETMERLLGALMEHLWEMGCHRVVGPTGLSPHLESGVLQNFFQLSPPLHTPYQPPYLPELMESVMTPIAQSQLYTIDLTATPSEIPTGPAQLQPLVPEHLSQQLLPLLAAACEANGDYPPPTAVEADFMLRWLRVWPLVGWLAMVQGQPVGFVLLQSDLSPSIRRANGGRNLLWRTWLKWRSQHSVRAGRLLYGGVLPTWRGQGIGRQLWHQALRTAQAQSWQTLTIGPVTDETPGAPFLKRVGAQVQQRYLTYASEL